MRIFLALTLVLSFTGCNKPPETQAPPTSSATPQETGLERIPEPDSSKYPRMESLAKWQNPQLVVREDGIGLVDAENHEIHILKIEQVEAELVSLPASAWPYGRVVLLSQASARDNSEQSKAQLRENRGLLVGTLKTLDVKIREAPGSENLPGKQ